MDEMIRQEFDRCRVLTEAYLTGCFQEDLPQKRLMEAMRYSLLAGGKRIRPILTMQFCKAAGGRPEDALPFACALEMLHTYSLIHDDLPCMDDDILRRGKPTNHVVYGECTATLAGDALQAAAFETVLTAPLPAEQVVQAGRELAKAAGYMGICGGQQLDMDGEASGLTLEEITDIHEKKTASMLIACAKMGVIAAGGSAVQLEAAEKYAAAVGLAFQICDDILDCTSTTEELGKPVGSDAESGKSTYVSLLGIEKCRALIREKTEEAVDALSGVFDDTAFLAWLAAFLAERKY